MLIGQRKEKTLTDRETVEHTKHAITQKDRRADTQTDTPTSRQAEGPTDQVTDRLNDRQPYKRTNMRFDTVGG